MGLHAPRWSVDLGMHSRTLKRCKHLAVLGVLIGPVFWVLKRALVLFHVLRDSSLAGGPETLVDQFLDAAWWDAVALILLAVTCCSLILLFVIVAPPPRDGEW